MGFGKGITETLFLTRYGIEFLPTMFMLTALGLLITGLVYGSIVDIVTPHRLMKILVVSTAAVIIGSWALIQFMTMSLIYPALYLLQETTCDLFAVHLMFYVSQNLHLSQSKRLSPIILSGISIGGMISGVGLGIGTLFLSLDNMLWLWVISLLSGALLVRYYHHKHGPSPFFHSKKKGHYFSDSLKNIQQGISFTKRSPLLLSLCLSLFFTVIAYYTLKYLINLTFVTKVPGENTLATLIGSVIAFNSIAGLFVQIFVTNRFFEKFGIRIVSLIFPVSMIASNALFLFGLHIPTAFFGSFVRDTLMGAFRNPSYNLFFEALPPAMQGRSRSMTLMFVLPISLLCVGLLLHFMQKSETHIPITMIGVIATIFLFWFGVRTNKVYYDTLITTMSEATYLGKSDVSKLAKPTPAALDELKQGLQSDERHIVLYYARRLMKFAPDEAHPAILHAFNRQPNRIKIELAELLVTDRPEELNRALWECFDSSNDHEETCAILHLLMDIEDSTVFKKAATWAVKHKSPCADGIRLRILIHNNPADPAVQQTLESLLSESDPESPKVVLNILLRHREVTPPGLILQQLQSPLEVNVLTTLALIRNIPDILSDKTLLPMLEQRMETASYKVKLAIVEFLASLETPGANQLLYSIFEENHQRNVRQHALSELHRIGGIPETLFDNLINDRVSFSGQIIILDSTEPFFSRDEIKALVENRVNKASRIHDFLQQIQLHADESLQYRLLETLLEEQFQQSLDTCLAGLSLIENQKGINIVRAVLHSHDRQYSGLAFEALKNLNHTDISGSIIKLLASLLDPSGKQHHLTPIQLDDAIHWCMHNCSPWVKQCLSQAQDSTMIDFLEKTLLLKQSRLFGDIHTEDIQSIAEILVEDFYQAGDRIFDLGDTSDHCYIIHSGKVGISLHQAQDKKEFVAILEKGDYFGEMGILDNNLRSATAHVIEDVQLLSISRVQFQNIIQQHPEVAVSMLTRMNSIIRVLNKQLALAT